MSAIGDYLRETRSELNHVAWPTRAQTIVYTILVALISVGVALYLGVFDFVFTGALSRVVGSLSTQGGVQVTQTQPTLAPTLNLGTSTVK
jgi:preprotein translocase SecE subunit